MKNVLLIACLVSILPVCFFAQEKTIGTVKGKVTDFETKEALTNATVFLENTTFGTVTDLKGSYEIADAEPGTYTLIASMVGYEIKKIPVQITAGRVLEVNAVLRQKPVVLGQVNVIGKVSDDWQGYLEIFEREFLGTSKYSGSTKILNPEVINFRKDKDTKQLTAFSDSTIVVENRAMGYKLFILLEYFSYDTNGEIDYLAHVRFLELTSPDSDEKEDWKEKRLYCYLGSQKHFFRSLISNRLYEEGFRVKMGPMYSLIKGGGNYVSEKDLRVEDYGDGVFMLPLETGLKVEFLERNLTVSYVIPVAPFILLDKSGNRADKNNMKVAGYWAEQRMSSALPYNYSPGR